MSTHGEPELEKEKIVTRAICKVLAGFHYSEVPDAVDAVIAKSEAMRGTAKGGEQTLFGQNFAEVLQQQLKQKAGEAIPVEEGKTEATHQEKEADIEEEVEGNEEQVCTTDLTMSKEQVADIQAKLLHKVLPVLERHLTDSKDSHAVRSFVAVCYVQTIRRLPLSNFDRCLHRVVNLIVTRGLRSRDLSHREKARKALIRVLSELRPEFLPVVFEEMKQQLVKGYQQHVYLFTVHHLLASLHEAGSLQPGSISYRSIELNIDLLLSELFGDLDEEKTNAQGNELKLIKESKLRKAIPIFEILAQYVDFRSTFLSLLAPIIKVLDESPSFSKI